MQIKKIIKGCHKKDHKLVIHSLQKKLFFFLQGGSIKFLLGTVRSAVTLLYCFTAELAVIGAEYLTWMCQSYH